MKGDLQPHYRRMLLFIAACVVALFAVGAAINRTPILRGYLQGPLDGNGQSITNAGSVETTNLTVKGGTVTGLASSVTNGDSSISTVSTSGVHYVRATNITEAKLLLSDNTTADATTSVHGFIPKVSATSNSISLNWNGTLTWKVLTNLLRAGTGITLADTNGIVTVHASAITEDRLSFSDNTTADSTTSAHGLLPKVSGTSNSIALNWNGAFEWRMLTNLIRAGTNIVFLDTNGIVTIHSSASGGGSSLSVNGTSATDANITNTSTMVWGILDSTNVVGYPTNLANSQISGSAAIAKSKVSSSGTWTAAEIPTLQTTADGGGNTIKMKGYIVLASPFSCDGAGSIIETNNNALAYFGQALMSGTAATNANYIEYRITVPEDIDTSIDLKVERWKFRLSGADTGAHTYNIAMASVADSASYDSPTLGQWVALSFAGDGSGASGDVETVSNVTLTSWKSNVTAGELWVIRVNRDGAGDASTVAAYSGPLVISYGITQ